LIASSYRLHPPGFYLSNRSFDSINAAAVFLESSYPALLARADVSTGMETLDGPIPQDLGGVCKTDVQSFKRKIK
jgi:hypothetical protein